MRGLLFGVALAGLGAACRDKGQTPAPAPSPEGALAVGADAGDLRRMVAAIDLRNPSRAAALAARVRELGATMTEPRASAVLLRALAVIDKAEASRVGCDVLTKMPSKETKDEPDRDYLTEAAL